MSIVGSGGGGSAPQGLPLNSGPDMGCRPPLWAMKTHQGLPLPLFLGYCPYLFKLLKNIVG